jgi:hypothetical protein
MANKKVQPLTDTAIKNAKAREKEYTLSDGNGLQLVIKPNGRKVWEIRYTVNAKAKKTTGGTYPVVSLKDARVKLDELKNKVLNGIDPIQEKKALKAIGEFALQRNTPKSWRIRITKEYPYKASLVFVF